MAAEHLLALDAGSTGARCLIARPGDGPVAVARQAWSYDTPAKIAPLGRSFDAETFWTALCAVTRQALSEAKLSGGDIAAVGVTSQRLGLVVVDSDGQSLQGMPNADARAVAEGFAIDGRIVQHSRSWSEEVVAVEAIRAAATVGQVLDACGTATG